MDVLAEVVRSGLVESRHRGVAVGVDPAGEVVWSLGDPGTVIFPRSANKPIQTLGMLRAGLPLDGRLLALASASHSGEPFHLDGVREILALAGLDESTLQTPPSYPLDPHVHADYLRAGGKRDPICMDCSGKHAAMLLTCVANGWSTDDYYAPGHPLQRALIAAVEEYAGESVAAVGVDGCGAPVAAISLTGLATGFLRVSAHEVADAMRAHPEMVSGTGREDALLMRAVPGLVCKGGAEGVWAAAVPGIGAVALKIDDGGKRACGPVMISALKRLGLAVDVPELVSPALLGRGEPVGGVHALW